MGNLSGELLNGLCAWASFLSGSIIGLGPARDLPKYAYEPAHPPAVVWLTHEEIVERECGGQECKAFAFHDKKVIYLDNRLDPENNLLHASVIVHECVHYMQMASGQYNESPSCEQSVGLEKDAYSIQRDYLLAYGVYQPVGAAAHQAFQCESPAP